MNLDYWILEDKVPRAVGAEEWAKWLKKPFEKRNRVGKTAIGDREVSTVFLGIDHQWRKGGAPLLFETMVFGEGVRDHEDMMWRYSTWDEAIAGHERVVAALRTGAEPDL